MHRQVSQVCGKFADTWFGLGRALEILQVAGHAGRAIQTVVVADVAIGAEPWRHGVQAGQRKPGRSVIESAIGPQIGVVALFAGQGEYRRCVGHRSRRIVVVGLMAGNAGRIRDRVVVVDMAIGASARRHHVIPSQREACAAVIEGRIEPGRSAVALVAGLREVRRDVVRVGRAQAILQVAGHAGRAIQTVVVADVAIGAEPRWHGVQAGQIEARRRMVKLTVGPQVRVVALFAGQGESRRRVGHGARRIVVIGLVAGNASRVRNRVIVVDVAIGASARRHHVVSRQWEARAGVIEGRIQPGRCGVALLAGLREVRRRVVRIGRALVVLQVARDAGRRGDVVVVADVAVGTESWWHGVQASQSEARARMVELAIGPQIGVVALFAGQGESRRCVRHRGGRVVVVGLVARDASGIRNRVIVELMWQSTHARGGTL